MDDRLRRLAEQALGFMPSEEGLALHDAALETGPGPLVEIGSYCGKSTIYLGAAARAIGRLLFSIDHHRGSEEHQVGQEYYDQRLTDPETGRVDTLPSFRTTIAAAGLDDVVIGVVGDSATVARGWRTPVGFVFIDGGHSAATAKADYSGWAPLVAPKGLLAIHDVFEDPRSGGRPPFEIYRAALSSGRFVELAAEGSLRVLQRVES